ASLFSACWRRWNHSHSVQATRALCEGRTKLTDTNVAADSSAALSAMKLPQLQALASELGVSGASKMKKSDLVDAIQNGGGVADAAPAVGSPQLETNAPSAPAAAPDAASDAGDGDRARRAAEAVA